MADTTTKKILIEVEARYVSISNALKEMSNLAVQIDALKTLRKAEADTNGKTSQTYITLDTNLKSLQKEYNTLNRFVVAANVSAKAMSSTLAEGGDALLSQEAQLAKLTLAWKGMSAETRATPMGQGLKAQIDSVTQSLYANGTQLDKNKLTVGNYAGAIEGLIVKMGKEGQAVSATSQAYSALLMKYQMAEAETRQLILTKGADDAASIEAIARMKQYGMELDKLNGQMGKYQAKTVNASYATFSLSQVVREMPNFAIDARLGFMALSNNLPMLAQDFQMLTTQLGSASKALKAFGKSLLGINTVMVLLSTVLIAWGPQMWNWIKSIFSGAKATDVYTQKLEALNSVLKKGDSGLKSAIANQVKLGVVLQKATEGTISADAAVKEYNETLGDSYGKVKTLSEAVAGYKQYSQQFIAAKIAEAAALKLTDQTSDDVIKKEQSRTELRKLSNLSELNAQSENIRAAASRSANGLAEYKRLLNSYIERRTLASKIRWGEKLTDVEEEFAKLLKIDNAGKWVKQMSKMDEANDSINATTKTIASLYNQINLDWKPQDNPEKDAKDKAAALQKIAEADAEYQESAIKAEEGYQSEDFESKAAYEKRLFGAKQVAEKAKLKILLDYNQLTQAEYNKQIKTLENSQKEFDNNQIAEAAKHSKEMLEKQQKAVEDARSALLQMLGDNEAAEIQAINETYTEKVKAYEKALGDIANLTDEQLFEMVAIELAVEEQKQKDILEIKEKYRKAAEEASRAGIIKQFSDETVAAKQSIEEKYKAEKKRVDSELKLLDEKYAANAKMDEKDAARYRKLLEDRTANDKRYEENKVAIKEWFQEKATEILSAIDNVAAGFDERDKERAQTTRDEAVLALDEKLSKGLISQKNHDNQVKKLDENLDKEKQKIARRQAIRERLMATISIGINTAKAIMGIWAEFPKVDFGVSAGIATGVVSALGVAQIAAVLAQPIPKAEKGMILHGPSHAGGGIPIEAEGGEAIINRKSTTMFKPLLSAINEAGGGVRFASGGIPVGLANDGGFAARQAVPLTIAPTARDIAEAIASMPIYVSVEQFEKQKGKMARAKSRADL